MALFDEELITFKIIPDKQMVNLKKVILRRHSTLGYYLDVTYTVETPEEIKEINIPKVMLGLNNHSFTITRRRDYVYGLYHMFADIGLGNKDLLDQKGDYFTEKLIETKTKEMTLDEIEKKLGHKVKIINE